MSFISLRTVLPVLAEVAAPEASSIVLVKPQFEAGPADVGRGGVVRSPRVWRRVLDEIVSASEASGLLPIGVMASPVRGPAGNVEFLLQGRKPAGSPRVTSSDLDGAVAEGERVAG